MILVDQAVHSVPGQPGVQSATPPEKKKKRQDSIGFPSTKTIKTFTHFTTLSYVVKLQSVNEGVKPLSPVYVGLQTDEEGNMQPDMAAHPCDSSYC